MYDDNVIEKCARAAHEANSDYCRKVGDAVIEWDSMDDAMQNGVKNGARMVLDGTTHEELHAAWSKSRLADGWVHGPVKDFATKRHPCLVPYAELPEAQRRKDAIFAETVRATYASLAR